MEKTAVDTAVSNDLILNVSGKRKKFKAGSELSSGVNMVDLSYNVTSEEDSELFEMKLHLKQVQTPAPPKAVIK